MTKIAPQVRVRLKEGVPIDALPKYTTVGAAGADVRAFIPQPLTIPPGGRALIPTGLFFEIPEGYEVQVRPRSGLALNSSLTVLNTPGTVDSDYRGEIKVLLINHGSDPFVVESGMRIAQLVVAPVVQAEFLPMEELSVSLRGESGFGHTGLH